MSHSLLYCFRIVSRTEANLRNFSARTFILHLVILCSQIQKILHRSIIHCPNSFFILRIKIFYIYTIYYSYFYSLLFKIITMDNQSIYSIIPQKYLLIYSAFSLSFFSYVTKALILEFLLSHFFTILSLQCGTNIAKQRTACLFIPSFYQRKYFKLLRLFYATDI